MSNDEYVYGFKFLDTTGATHFDTGEFVYTLPARGEKWSAPTDHPDPTPIRGDYGYNDCGAGRLHVMRSMSNVYCEGGWPWYARAKVEDRVGESSEKFSAVSIQLRRINKKTLVYMLRRGWLPSTGGAAPRVATLMGLNLNGVDLHGANLEDFKFDRSSFVEANFKDARLHYTFFTKANMVCANFENAQLVNARLHHANLDNARLVKTNLHMVKANDTGFECAYIESSSFEDASLQCADFSYSGITDTSFHDADLTLAIFHRASLDNVDFSNANLYGANLAGCDLRKTNLAGARIAQAILVGARMTRDQRKALSNAKKSLKEGWMP